MRMELLIGGAIGIIFLGFAVIISERVQRVITARLIERQLKMSHMDAQSPRAASFSERVARDTSQSLLRHASLVDPAHLYASSVLLDTSEDLVPRQRIRRRPLTETFSEKMPRREARLLVPNVGGVMFGIQAF